MEIQAVITALSCIQNKVGNVIIITDSQYVLGCATKGWKRDKNQDLWKKYDEVFNKASSLAESIEFNWTKGHEDDKYNNQADELAVEASNFL